MTLCFPVVPFGKLKHKFVKKNVTQPTKTKENESLCSSPPRLDDDQEEILSRFFLISCVQLSFHLSQSSPWGFSKCWSSKHTKKKIFFPKTSEECFWQHWFLVQERDLQLKRKQIINETKIEFENQQFIVVLGFLIIKWSQLYQIYISSISSKSLSQCSKPWQGTQNKLWFCDLTSCFATLKYAHVSYCD